MGRVRLLLAENKELGEEINSGHIAKLEGELALQKNFVEEVKKSQLGITLLSTHYILYIYICIKCYNF